MNLPQSFMHFITAHYSTTQCNRKLPNEMQQHSKITKTKQHNETQRYVTQTFKATLCSYHKVNKSLIEDVARAFQLFTLVRCISHHFPRSSVRKIHFGSVRLFSCPRRWSSFDTFVLEDVKPFDSETCGTFCNNT